jgi:hypothetical protein
MAGQRFRIRSATFTSFVAGLLLLFGLAFAPRAEAFVYWANGDTIARANPNGTGIERGFIVGAGYPDGVDGVAVDDAHIYWTNDTGIGRANLDGTGVDQGFIADALDSTGGVLGLHGRVAVDDAHVYWTPALGPPGARFPLAIGRANLDGTGVDQSFIVQRTPSHYNW